MSVAVEKSVRSVRKAKGAGHLRRGEILHAAERIFIREGYHGATIRKIAEEVGLSSTALYMHFRDKSEILVEICEDAFAQLISQNDQIADLPLEPVARVRRMLEAYIEFGMRNPNAYQLVFASPPGVLSSEKFEAINALGHRCYAPFAGAVRAMADSGRLICEVDSAAQALWSATHGLISLMITQPQFPWSDPPETRKALMLDMLFHGLLAP